tara:strand:+ start:12236 stop:12796 length:561 start_codon:yes stop_codon:yes gene_type:complete
MNSVENIICKKNDIMLKKSKENDNFSLNFNVTNNNIDIKKIININLFILLYELNKDIIECAEVLSANDTNTNANIIYFFKQFGSELGMARKYMNLNINMITNNNNILFESNTRKNTSLDISNNKGEEIICNTSNLTVTHITKHSANFEYIFNMDINEDLPIYMENLIGVLMKKLFLKIKEFIENFK